MRYAFEGLEEGLDAWVDELDSPKALRAWKKLKFMVLSVAWVDFGIWQEGVDREQAMAWAWEDMEMAFRGFGDSNLTGAVVHLWTSIEEAKWEIGRRRVNTEFANARIATGMEAPRRYLLTYRCQTVRTPAWGFDLPSIVPVTGPRLKEWASKNGLDPEQTEAQMMLIEEYERKGLIKLSEEIEYFTDGPFSPDNLKSPAAPMESDPQARSAEGLAPKLTLIAGGSD